MDFTYCMCKAKAETSNKAVFKDNTFNWNHFKGSEGQQERAFITVKRSHNGASGLDVPRQFTEFHESLKTVDPIFLLKPIYPAEMAAK